MAEITLAAETGRATGSRSSGRLRAQGKVPATVYGLGGDPLTVSVVWRELRGALTTDAGVNALINLAVDGHATELTIVKDMQRHAIRRDVLHVDFLRVSRDVAIEVDVPILLTGEARAVLANDGLVDQLMFSITVSAKPGSIPDELTVDISDLEIGSAIRVGDLTLPTGVETSVDVDEPIVLGQAPSIAALELEAEDAEAAAAAEAEGGEAGAEPEAGDTSDESTE
ncbi:MAG: 50S ribosomal protein L25 [Acidimicrobiales bacterium]